MSIVYVRCLVAVHGIAEPSLAGVRERIERVVADELRPRLRDDVEVEVVEYAGEDEEAAP